jgi:hypothetical protein
MTMHNQRDTQNSIQKWERTRTRNERSTSDRNESGGEEALEGPVVGSVRARGRREGGRVIDGAFVDGWMGETEQRGDKGWQLWGG